MTVKDLEQIDPLAPLAVEEWAGDEADRFFIAPVVVWFEVMPADCVVSVLSVRQV